MTLSHVGVRFAQRKGLFGREHCWALRDVCFDLHQGETLGVIGRNGAGKSTLLQVLAGIIGADRGELRSRARSVSMLSLQLGFIPYLSGRDNAILSGMLFGRSRRDMLGRIDQIIDFSGLRDSVDHPIKTYSAGMRARLGFAVAFEVDPDVLLIDEVLGVGDTEFRAKSAAAMRERCRSDKTIVLVSHSDTTITELCDRAVWIEAGETRMEGSPKEVVDAYQSARPGKLSPGVR